MQTIILVIILLMTGVLYFILMAMYHDIVTILGAVANAINDIDKRIDNLQSSIVDDLNVNRIHRKEVMEFIVKKDKREKQ